MKRRITFAFLVLSLSWSCLDPYEVNVTNYQDLLVVNALITDEVKNHQIHLSRSVPNLDEIPPVESGALVVITDENNNEEVLTEVAPGVYETDKSQFVAKVGGTYTLSIRTKNGKEYTSNACTIQPKSIILDVHYKVGKEWNNDETRELEGLNILVDGSSYEGGELRWLYEEDWKFKVPYPSRVIYDYEIDDWKFIKPQNVVCWKKDSTKNIIIKSFSKQKESSFINKEVCFIPSAYTDKLTIRYSILVKQLSITKEESEYLSKLKNSLEKAGDISGIQPFSILGNIICVNNSKEPVLGYFQTGSVVSKRIYINKEDISKFSLPNYDIMGGCKLTTIALADYPDLSILDLYESSVINGSKRLFDLYYFGGLAGIIVTEPVCNDCTLTGTSQKPDFWED